MPRSRLDKSLDGYKFVDMPEFKFCVITNADDEKTVGQLVFRIGSRVMHVEDASCYWSLTPGSAVDSYRVRILQPGERIIIEV